jgi:NADH dehydrogenase
MVSFYQAVLAGADGNKVSVSPFYFDEPESLVEVLRGAQALTNTCWARFEYDGVTFAGALANTHRLFQAARAAGVSKVVHLSVTNPSLGRAWPYFRGGAALEEALKGSGLAYTILRPAVLFGPGDILINSIAWALRRLPVFGLFGDGQYKLQPIHVDDLAALAVGGALRQGSYLQDAIGLETFSFGRLVATIDRAMGGHRPIVPVAPALGYAAVWALGCLMGDVLLTREEIEGLMRGLLCTGSPPAGTIRLSEWAREQAASLGRGYARELARRRDRQRAYV